MKSLAVIGKNVGNSLVKNSPTILTGVSVAGLLTTVAMAVTATPKAIEILDREMWDREVIGIEKYGSPIQPLTKKEIISLTWKCYIPTVLMGAATIGCIIGANSIHLRRNAALVSLYSIAESTLKEYQAKVIETLGEKKEKLIKEEILQDRVTNNPPKENQIIITGNGDTLCYDSLSGRYFKSDIEKIRRIQNDFNRSLISEMYKTLNEFYDELGLEETELGRNMGWTTEFGLLDISFSAKLTPDNLPCIVLDYRIGPRKL